MSKCLAWTKVILKEAYDSRSFNTEADALNGYLRGHGSFRQLVNLIADKKIIVFEYLSDDLHHVLYSRTQRKLKEEEVNMMTRVILKELVTIHEEGFAHTDLKSDNLVIDLDQYGLLNSIKLIDLGDSVKVEPTTDHPFTRPTYRAPEGLFGIPWTTKVDLWALSTLIMWGFTGGRMFSPLGLSETDETYLVRVLILQCAYFGPFSDNYVELSDDITMEHLHGIEGLVAYIGGRTRHRNTLAKCLSKETVDFLDRFMKLDPRDRPSAQDLLQDQWLLDVAD